MKTTLNAIKENGPCTEGYRKLLRFLGKTEADDEELDVLAILESNGLDDTVWCFRTVSGFDAEKRLFAVFCARQVQHHLADHRSLAAINVAERYANGDATDEELKTAHAAASAAYSAYAAARAANAAYYSACAAAYSARAAAYAAATYAAANAAANAATYAEIKPVLEAYLKELLLVK